MRIPRRSRGLPPRSPTEPRAAAALVAVAALVAACVASSPSPAPTDPGASPPSSPSVEPTTSPELSPSVDTDPSPSPPSPSPVIDPPWAEAGSLTAPDSGWVDGAVALGDGRVLALEPGEQALIAEIWDPATDSWRTTTPLGRFRSGGALVALRDGRALVIGGLNGDPDPWDTDTQSYASNTQSYSSAYVFDPARETWQRAGLMRTARTYPAAAVLPDGRVLVAGGYFHTGAVEAGAEPPGDPASTVSLAVQRATPAGGPAAGPLYDLDTPPVGYALATAEIFDPTAGTWSATGPMRYARVGAATTVLADGRVLVVGGDAGGLVVGQDAATSLTAEIYDPATGRFTLTGPLPAIDLDAFTSIGAPRPGFDEESWSDGTLIALADESAVLVGNGNQWAHQGCAYRTLRFGEGGWAVVGGTWVAFRGDLIGGADLMSSGPRRTSAYVGALADGRVLVAGGDSPRWDGPETRAAEILDPADDTWTSIPDLPTARAGGIAVPLPDGSVLLVGGHGYDGFVRETIRYVP